MPLHTRYQSEIKTVRMSNRLWAALCLIAAQPRQEVHSLNGLFVDQRSFGPLYHRGYLDYIKDRDVLRLNDEGRRAIYAFEHTDVTKKHASSQFSHYLRQIKELSGRFEVEEQPRSKRPHLVRKASAA